MLEYFLSPMKADLLLTDGGSSDCSEPPWLRACLCTVIAVLCTIPFKFLIMLMILIRNVSFIIRC